MPACWPAGERESKQANCRHQAWIQNGPNQFNQPESEEIARRQKRTESKVGPRKKVSRIECDTTADCQLIQINLSAPASDSWARAGRLIDWLACGRRRRLRVASARRRSFPSAASCLRGATFGQLLFAVRRPPFAERPSLPLCLSPISASARLCVICRRLAEAGEAEEAREAAAALEPPPPLRHLAAPESRGRAHQHSATPTRPVAHSRASRWSWAARVRSAGA